MSGSLNGMVVAVTGATGFVGRHMVRALLDRGCRVRALARDAAKAARVLPDHADLHTVVGGVFDGRTPGELVRGADACIHLIGIIREAGSGQTFPRMHVDTTRTVLRAAEDAGVRRFVHMSALGANPEGPSKYQRTKFEAERLVIRSEVDWTILRPGLILGPDGEFFEQVKGWAEGRQLPYFCMPYFTRIEVDIPPSPTNPPKVVVPMVSPADVRDVCEAFCAALERPESIGEVYPICGQEVVRFPDMLRAIRDALPQAKRDQRAIAIPGPLAVVKAFAWRLIGIERVMPFDVGMALMGQRDSRCDLTKSLAHLAYRPRALDEIVASCVS